MKRESLIPKANINLINDFINDMDVCERSKKTYRVNITVFFNWSFNRGYDYSKIDFISVLNFKAHLISEKRSNSTIDSYLTAVRKYYKWYSELNGGKNIAENIKGPKKSKTINKMPLSLKQAKELLNSFDINTPIGLRDHTIIKLLLKSALRISEIQKILISDIKDLSGKKVLYIEGKGHNSKDDFIQLTDDTFKSISKCIALSDIKSIDEPLFKSYSHQNPGEPITTRSISKIVKEHLIKIGLNDKRYTAHSLRHTAACLLIQLGANIYDVQIFMRHKDPSITQIYTRYLEEEMKLSNECGLRMDKMFNN